MMVASNVPAKTYSTHTVVPNCGKGFQTILSSATAKEVGEGMEYTTRFPVTPGSRKFQAACVTYSALRIPQRMEADGVFHREPRLLLRVPIWEPARVAHVSSL